MTNAKYDGRYKQCPMLDGNCADNKNQRWYHRKRKSVFASFSFDV
ncbi:hypothetical protein [uncultured Eubacterium sp.]|nr:hypothetical protein [uncultured Eubacterium sp.]